MTNEQMTVQQLLSHYSDFYKEIHGFRPMFSKPGIDYTEAEAQALIASCHAYLNAVAGTPEGRQQLENEGWILNDTQSSEDDEHDSFRDDVEADADTLRSAGFGTDEEYGYADEVL